MHIVPAFKRDLDGNCQVYPEYMECDKHLVSSKQFVRWKDKKYTEYNYRDVLFVAFYFDVRWLLWLISSKDSRKRANS